MIVKHIYPRPQIVDHHQVVQPIPVQIPNAKLADLVVETEDFRAGEPEANGVGLISGHHCSRRKHPKSSD